MKAMRKFIYFHFFKRFLDIVFSFLLLVVMFPLVLITGALVYSGLGWPILAKKRFTGQNEKPFTLYSFRTEKPDGSESSFGKGLISSGLHELPVFVNIIRGDMSFIGPRPLPLEDTLFMNAEQKIRYAAKPGMTGWAQVNGGKNLSWEDTFTYDYHYIESLSFRMDISTLMMTLAAGFKQESVSLDDSPRKRGLGEHLLEAGQIDQETYDKTLDKLNQV
ncbi:MAG: sugar transferase [Spirochaetales bacterium]|jgi:undecaprenyl phosphate N,N'-diacetylbacillosamine 1-phosphate transferase|nr:sugar transferase [Spirochaetales bacterium]